MYTLNIQWNKSDPVFIGHHYSIDVFNAFIFSILIWKWISNKNTILYIDINLNNYINININKLSFSKKIIYNFFTQYGIGIGVLILFIPLLLILFLIVLPKT